MVADEADDVSVTRDDPQRVPRIPVDRIGLEELREEGVGISDRLGGEQVVEISRLSRL